MKAEFIELVLACISWQEAHNIADALFEKRFITHAEFLPVSTSGNSLAKAVKLVMRSSADSLVSIEKLVAHLKGGKLPKMHLIPVYEFSLPEIMES